MIPLMAIVGFRTQKRRIFRLWIPLFLIWLLLLPLVLVLLPLAFVALVVVRINPFRAFRTLWQVLTGLKGTYVEVNEDDAFVLLRIF